MGQDRDSFANFDRMRREMDELFGDVLQRGRRRRRGFSPAVDVFSCEDPSRVVVQADLAGVRRGDIELEVRGRELVLAGVRQPGDSDGRTYQQLEIEHGAFRRVVALGADVDADNVRAVFANGMLRVELPTLPAQPRARQVPISDAGEEGEVPS